MRWVFLFVLWPRFWFVWCCFSVCLASAGETQVWLGDLRVVAFCVVVVFVGFIDLLISRTYRVLAAYSHVRTEP